MKRLMRPLVLVSMLVALFTQVVAQAADPIVVIASRGQKIRAILLKPANPKGAVILLTGGNGRLDLDPPPSGNINTPLSLNQLVRTRAQYANFYGYVTLVPDVAPDLKSASAQCGFVKCLYRISKEHAEDIGAMVMYLRSIVVGPVVVIGTSRGSISAANAVAKLATAGKPRPEGEVLTSAYLDPNVQGPTERKAANDDPLLLKVPTLVVWNTKDTCPDTLPSAVPAFQNWFQMNGLTLSLKSFTHNGQPGANICEAKAPHGFWGIDDDVVKAITAWIGQTF